ncbi:hypothetical protein BASA60_003594, partial [Batrachochytrium salamandrivorans]
MKLISFAALSLLAITVSAYPHQNPDERDLEESQGATTQILLESQSVTAQDLQGNPRQWLWNEFDKLHKEYEAKQVVAAGLQDEIDEMEKEMSDVKSRADASEEPVKTNLLRDFLAKNEVFSILQESKRILERELKGLLKQLCGLGPGQIPSIKCSNNATIPDILRGMQGHYESLAADTTGHSLDLQYWHDR